MHTLIVFFFDGAEERESHSTLELAQASASRWGWDILAKRYEIRNPDGDVVAYGGRR